MNNKWEDEYLLSNELINFFYTANFVCANIEGAVINLKENEIKGDYIHYINPNITKVLNRIGANIWSIGQPY